MTEKKEKNNNNNKIDYRIVIAELERFMDVLDDETTELDLMDLRDVLSQICFVIKLILKKIFGEKHIKEIGKAIFEHAKKLGDEDGEPPTYIG